MFIFGNVLIPKKIAEISLPDEVMYTPKDDQVDDVLGVWFQNVLFFDP